VIRRTPRRLTLGWTNSPLRIKGLVVVAIPLIAILVSAGSYLLIERQDQAAEAVVERSQRISADIARAVNILLDAENGVRGYLLSGDVDDLKPFGNAQGTLPMRWSIYTTWSRTRRPKAIGCPESRPWRSRSSIIWPC